MMVVPTTSPHSGSNLPSSGGSSTPRVKQSRVVISQSKSGCVNCKARRIKCDEHKPMCWRCVRGGRICGGYGQERDARSASALQPSLKDGVHLDKQAERLGHLASLVMSLDRNSQPLHEDGVWGRPFLQLSHAVDCVKAAAVAFGAAYESLLNGHIPQDHPPALYYYGSALQQLQRGVNNGTAGAESCALASLILACVEILSQQEQNAFAHFLGACQILDIWQQQHTSSTATSEILESVRQELVMIDVLIGSYTMSETPAFLQLEPQETATAGDAFSQPGPAIKASSFSLHRAYRFIGRAGPYRYRDTDYVESDPVMRQDRAEVVSELSSVYDSLERLTRKVEAQVSTVAVSTLDNAVGLAEMYALRCQLTSALIFILSIHSPFETTYDGHQGLFQTIISDAAASIRTRRRFKSGAFSQFSCRPGVLAPLFMVSMKCRDPSLRRLATAMLKEQGREGPADGQLLAAIGAQLAETEESASSSPPPGSLQNACDIHEGHRIHGYYVDTPKLTEGGKRVVRVSFSMANPPLLQGWGTVDYAGGEGWSFCSKTLEL